MLQTESVKPVVVPQTERRRSPRFKLALPVRVLGISGKAVNLPGTTWDLSAGGAYFVIDGDVEPGDRVHRNSAKCQKHPVALPRESDSCGKDADGESPKSCHHHSPLPVRPRWGDPVERDPCAPITTASRYGVVITQLSCKARNLSATASSSFLCLRACRPPLCRPGRARIPFL